MSHLLAIRPAPALVRVKAEIKVAEGLRNEDQKADKGVPEIRWGFCVVGWDLGERKERKSGYWKRLRPRVAEEVQRGRMRPRWPPRGWRGGMACAMSWLSF